MREIPNDERLRELVIYVSKKSASDPAFGAVKLNKLLFYSDFLSFSIRHRSITGHEYERLDHGPAPRAIVPTIKRLVGEGAVERLQRTYCGKIQITTIAKREPDLSVFADDDIAFVDQIIEFFDGKSGTHLSTRSHRFAGWKFAEKHETIPYDVVRVGVPRDPTRDEFEWALSLKDSATRCLAGET